MSAPLAPDFTHLTALWRQLQLQAGFDKLAEAEAGKPLNEKGLKSQTIDFATYTVDNPFQLNTLCWGFHILKRSSHPGTQLVIQGGGKSAPLGPGDWVHGRCEQGLVLQPGPLCPTVGTCELQLITNPTVSTKEWEGPGVGPMRQVILGTINNAGSLTFVPVTENTDPTTLLATDGVFDATGFTEIELWVDTWLDVGNKVTTADLYPWFVPKGNSGTLVAFWAQQPDKMKSLQDSVPTSLRYRVMSWALSSAPEFSYWSIRNLLPAGATQLGLLVIGVK